MIDNWRPKVVIGDTSPYNDNIYYNSGYFFKEASEHKINDNSPLEIRRSNTKRGCRLDDTNPWFSEDIYLQVVPTDDGTKEIGWYYLEDSPCDISEDNFFFLDSGHVNYAELSGFRINNKRGLNYVRDAFDTAASGNVLNMHGMSFNSSGYYFLNFDNFAGTIIMPNTNNIDIRELSFEYMTGEIQNLYDMDLSDVTEINLHGAQLNSWDMHGVDLSSCTSLGGGFSVLGDINLSDITFGTTLPLGFFPPPVGNITGWDLSHLGSTKLSALSLVDGQNYNLTGWKIPNAPIDVDDGDYVPMFEAGYYHGQLNVTDWDLSSCININGLFYADTGSSICYTGFSTWDVSNIVSMEMLFYNSSLPNPTDIANWDVSSVTNFNKMLNSGYYGDDGYYDTNGVFHQITDLTSLNGWRNNLSPTANYNQMVNNGLDVYPEWNGWFDEQGTFIPYTDSGISGGVYFKGFASDYPSNPSLGDAYRISVGGVSGYYAYNGSTWISFTPTPPSREYLQRGYYYDCEGNDTMYYYPETSGPCGEFEIGETMDFYEGEGGYNPLGQYEFDGVGWFND